MNGKVKALDRKKFPDHARTSAPARAGLRPCGEGSQTGEGYNTGNKPAGFRKHQNRGSRNSTGDGF